MQAGIMTNLKDYFMSEIALVIIVLLVQLLSMPILKIFPITLYLPLLLIVVVRYFLY